MPRIFRENIIAVSTFDSIDIVQLIMISITSFKIMESSELECPWSAGGIDLCLVGAIYTRFPKYGAIYTSTPNRLIYGGRGIDHCIS